MTEHSTVATYSLTHCQSTAFSAFLNCQQWEKWHSWHLDAPNRGKVNGMKSASCHSSAPGPALQLHFLSQDCSLPWCWYTHTNTNTQLLLCVCSLNRVLRESVSVYCLYVPVSVLPDVYLCRTMGWPGKTWAQEVWSGVCACECIFLSIVILIAYPWFVHNSLHDTQNTLHSLATNVLSLSHVNSLVYAFLCSPAVNTVLYLLCCMHVSQGEI